MILPDAFEGRALITGASGFIGGRLRDALLDAGADVVAIKRPTSPEPKRGRAVVARYDDVDRLRAVMAEEKPDVVFHVAGSTNGVSYADFQRANVMPTANLLTALADAHPGVKRFVYVSSLTSFGPSTAARPLRETDPRRPIEHYGRSKLEAEQVVEAMGNAVPWTIIRPSGVYGPGDYEFFTLFKEAEAGRNLFYGNRKRWFSAVYVDDCVRGIVACAKSDETVGKGYFLCDGHPVTWEMFQQAILDASSKKGRAWNIDLPGFVVPLAAAGGELLSAIDGKPRLFNKQKATLGVQEAHTCVHDAAAADFGYRPEVMLDEGIRRSFTWYREEGWLK